MNTTTNTGAASLNDEQREQLHLIERCDPSLLIHHIEEDTAYDGPLVARVFELAKERASALLATPTPQADAAPTFEAWATNQGLISESHGVRFVNSMCDVARKAWDAAIAAGGAQEAVAWGVMTQNGYAKFVTNDEEEAKRWKDVYPSTVPLYAAPLHREAATVWQPIKTAPRDGSNILIRFGRDGVSQAKYVPGTPHPWKFIDTNDGVTWLINHAVDTEYGPTHWMPLPAAPAASNWEKK